MHKRTPGPWLVGYWGGQCHKEHPEHPRGHPGQAGPNPCVYDTVFREGTGIAAAEPNTMVVSTSYDELCISEADAQLIAAAPELLDMCKAALAAWKGEGPPLVLDELRAIIAKAECYPPNQEAKHE
jgi:hypothetical protein